MPCSKKVLIVEDEEAIRETLDLMLRMDGYDVETASNGMEALAVLSRIQSTLPDSPGSHDARDEWL